MLVLYSLLFPFYLFLCFPRIAVPEHLLSFSVVNPHLVHPFSLLCPHHSLSPVALLDEHQVVKLLAGSISYNCCSYPLRLLRAGQKPPECLWSALLSLAQSFRCLRVLLPHFCKCEMLQLIQLSALLFYLTSYSSSVSDVCFFVLYNIS